MSFKQEYILKCITFLCKVAISKNFNQTATATDNWCRTMLHLFKITQHTNFRCIIKSWWLIARAQKQTLRLLIKNVQLTVATPLRYTRLFYPGLIKRPWKKYREDNDILIIFKSEVVKGVYNKCTYQISGL